MLVFILNKHGEPLMPCSESKARRLLKEGKVKVVNRMPFTIKLKYGSSGFKQQLELKVDAGSKVVGCAVVNEGKVLYASEVKTRNTVHKNMIQRAMYRRNRRSRKTRYREPRFDNRKRISGWLTPTVMSKIQTHLREINFVKSILPITNMIIETASFDIYKITDIKVSGIDYQTGQQKDFYNTKAFVLSRDKHTCQKCKLSKTGTKLNIHHIIFRRNEGTDSPDNLITLCENCHNKLHLSNNAQKNSLKLQNKRKVNTTDATQVSTICSYLRKHLQFQETFGYETKFNREILGLPKTHFIDAMCVGLGDGEVIEVPKYIFKKVSIARGDYPQTESSPGKNGKRSRLPRSKILGIKRFDTVKYFNSVAFIKGRMSTGYGILMNIDGEILDFGHVPKLNLMKRIKARTSCLTNQIRIENFTSNTILYSSVSIEKISLKKKKLIPR